MRIIVFILFLLSFGVVNAQDSQLNVDNDTVYNYLDVDTRPTFKGGLDSMLIFIQRNLRYPPEYNEASIQGRVVVKFIVEKEGALTNICIVKSVDELIDKEAVRVVSIMPNWLPAIKNGKIVRCFYIQPIVFKVEEY